MVINSVYQNYIYNYSCMGSMSYGPDSFAFLCALNSFIFLWLRSFFLISHQTKLIFQNYFFQKATERVHHLVSFEKPVYVLKCFDISSINYLYFYILESYKTQKTIHVHLIFQSLFMGLFQKWLRVELK